MLKIAIVGSCITRDLWPIRGGGAEQLSYICRTSPPSLLASPLEGFKPNRALPGDLHQHEHNALVADIDQGVGCAEINGKNHGDFETKRNLSCKKKI